MLVDQFLDRCSVGGCFVGADDPRTTGFLTVADTVTSATQRFSQKSRCCCSGASGGHVKVQSPAVLGDGPVEVAPPSTYPGVGFIHSPAVGEGYRSFAVPAGLFIQFGIVVLHPPVDGGVIHWCTTFSEHLFKVAVGHSVAAVPARSPVSARTTECPDLYRFRRCGCTPGMRAAFRSAASWGSCRSPSPWQRSDGWTHTPTRWPH